MLLRLQLADCQTCVTSISELSLRGFNLFAQWREPGVMKTRIRGLIIRNNYFIIDCVNECDPFLGLEHLPPKNVHMPDDCTCYGAFNFGGWAVFPLRMKSEINLSRLKPFFFFFQGTQYEVCHSRESKAQGILWTVMSVIPGWKKKWK